MIQNASTVGDANPTFSDLDKNWHSESSIPTKAARWSTKKVTGSPSFQCSTMWVPHFILLLSEFLS
jgi:hypothetical protein